MAVKPHEVRKGDGDHPGLADTLHPQQGRTIPHAPSTRDAAVLPRSFDGETIVEGPAGSDVGPRTPAGHIWDSSGTVASTPAPQGGADGTGTAASRGLRDQANSLQRENAGGT